MQSPCDDLRRFANNEPIRARPPSPLDYAKKWSSRHKTLVASAAIVLTVVFLAAIVTTGVVWIAFQETQAAFQSERDQRKETVKLWRKAEGLRLAARSALERLNNPGLALALAAEGHKLYPHRELNNALLAAFETNHEHRTLLGYKGVVGSVSFDKNGEKLITTVARTEFTKEPEPARIWNVATGELLVELNSEPTPLTSAAFSPGGVRVLATSAPLAFQAASIDGSDARHNPTIWDSVTGKKLLALSDAFLFEAHETAFDPTGQRVITPAVNNTARIWDVLEGNALARLEGHTKRVIYAAFDSQGEQVVTVSDDLTVRIWQARSGEAQLVLEHWDQPAQGPTFALFSPDGTKLATESVQNGIQIWDLATGNRINEEPWRGRTPRFTPDGSRLVFTHDLSTRIQQVVDGEVLHELRGQFVALSPDGLVVATQDGIRVLVWNVLSGDLVSELKGHDMTIAAAAFAPLSQYLATASYDHTARIWHVRSGADRLSFDTPLLRDNTVVAENSDGTRIAVAHSPEFRTQIIDIDQDRTIIDVPGTVWHPDVRSGRLLTTTRRDVVVYDAETGEEASRFNDFSHAVSEAELSYDGTHAILFDTSGPASIWRIETNNRITLNGHTGAVKEAALSPKSDFVATGSDDGTARIWDAKTGGQLHLLPHGIPVWSVRVNGDGSRLATVTKNNEAFLWDVSTGAELATLHAVSGLSFSRVEFSQDGEHLFGFLEDQSHGVVCWNAANGEPVGSIAPIRGRVRIATSPDDSRIVIASSVDGAVLWEPGGEQRVLTDKAVAFASFVADDRVVTATLGLRQDPQSFSIEERNGYVTPTLQVWNTSDGSLIQETTVPLGQVAWLGGVPDSRRVVVSAAFYGVSLFDLKSHKIVTELRGHSAPVSFVGFVNDDILTTSWDGTAAIWDAESGAQRRRLRGERAITAAAISPNTDTLSVGDAMGNVLSWAINEEKERVALKAHDDLVKIVAFRPEGEGQLVTSSLDQTTKIHHLNSDVTQTIEANGAIAKHIRYSTGGKRWLFVPAKETKQVGPGFDLSAPLEELNHSVLVYGGEQAEIEPRSFDAKSLPVDAHFFAEGRKMVTFAARHVIVWDVAEMQPLNEIAIEGQVVLAGDVSADEKLALTEHRDRVSLWSLETGLEIMTIPSPRPNAFFRETHFDPAGEHILTIVGQQLRAYPTHPQALIKHSPRQLTPSERNFFGVLDEKDWPRQ